VKTVAADHHGHAVYHNKDELFNGIHIDDFERP